MGGFFPIALNQKPDFILLDSAMLNLDGVLSRLNKPNLKLPDNSLKISSNEVPTIAFWGQNDTITVCSDNTFYNTDQVNVKYRGEHMQLFQSMKGTQIIQLIDLFILVPSKGNSSSVVKRLYFRGENRSLPIHK